jgi:hypothetical protein
MTKTLVIRSNNRGREVSRQLELSLVLVSAKQMAMNALTQVPEAPNVIQSQDVNSFMFQNYTVYTDVG